MFAFSSHGYSSVPTSQTILNGLYWAGNVH
ncbi:hypothetical protein AFERRI_420167 [Acidithiobacillus ferrivorans]|uniref:Uncharacterized protein n=1 Tax=Acidithiobacillus ferrivorans TaxID=160808 RepID=A0A060UWE8_9PROT|nr:hypothetical protein AFERRI_420167 [Acidithiobacillus ferrivorans]